MMEVVTLLFALGCNADDLSVPKAPEPASLASIKRIFVDRLTGGETAAQMRDMIISSLQSAKLFVLTEKEERADAVLRGAAEDLIYTDRFHSSDGVSAHLNAGTGSTRSRTGGRNAGISLSDNESTQIQERKHEAIAAVRLVDKNGDVIWSTTQESGGGKFRGASADVADRITRQLVTDVEKVKH